MDAFQTELIGRLSLAQATLALFEYAINAGFLQRIFQDNRGRCYEDELPFPSPVEMVRDALLVHDGSFNRSITSAKENGLVQVHPSAAYRKLANLPEGVSWALLRDGTVRLGEVTAGSARTLPACVGNLALLFGSKTPLSMNVHVPNTAGFWYRTIL